MGSRASTPVMIQSSRIELEHWRNLGLVHHMHAACLCDPGTAGLQYTAVRARVNYQQRTMQ